MRLQISLIQATGHTTVPPSALYPTLLPSKRLRSCNSRPLMRDNTCGETVRTVLRLGLRVALSGMRNLNVDTDKGPHTSQQKLRVGGMFSLLPNLFNVITLRQFSFPDTSRRPLSLQLFFSDLFVKSREKAVPPFLPALPLSYSQK